MFMTTRKIQKVNQGTFTISIPPDWARAEGIDKGEKVDVFTHVDGTLTVQPRNRKTDPTGEVSIEIQNNGSEHVRQALLAAYTAGYSDVTLTRKKGFSDDQVSAARDLVWALAGASITTDEEQKISIQILMDSGEISVPQLVRQISFVALSMYQTVMVAMVNNEPVSHLDDRDEQVNRLYSLIDRSFVRSLSRLDEVDELGIPRPELFKHWSTARDLERVADHAKEIGTLVQDLNCSQNSEYVSRLKELAEQTRYIVDRAVDCVLNEGQIDAGYEALSLRMEARKRRKELDRRLFEESTADYRLARILDSVWQISEHGGNIAERGLQERIRKKK